MCSPRKILRALCSTVFWGRFSFKLFFSRVFPCLLSITSVAGHHSALLSVKCQKQQPGHRWLHMELKDMFWALQQGSISSVVRAMVLWAIGRGLNPRMEHIAGAHRSLHLFTRVRQNTSPCSAFAASRAPPLPPTDLRRIDNRPCKACAPEKRKAGGWEWVVFFAPHFFAAKVLALQDCAAPLPSGAGLYFCSSLRVFFPLAARDRERQERGKRKKRRKSRQSKGKKGARDNDKDGKDAAGKKQRNRKGKERQREKWRDGRRQGNG